MKWIFNKIFIMKNPVIFSIFAILMIFIIVLTFVLVNKELKENADK